MPSIDPKLNTGHNNQPEVDEALIAAQNTAIPTVAVNSAERQTGVAESVSDAVGNVDTSVIPDISLFSGINIDNVLSLAGDFVGGLSISSLADTLQGSLGLTDIANTLGIGGLLGNLPISINANVAPQLEPAQNVLHNYASFTYRITMGAQDTRDHQITASEDFVRGTPKITTMLMGSGGARAVDGVTRDPIFNEDFYLDDIKMTTVIGATAQGNGSNAVGLSFTIMEPYAVSLIERLLALAEKLGYANYIEIPFIFKIEFVGYNDAGEMIGVVPQTTKYIPFRLTYMKFAVKGQGSMYECTGIPVNHFTYNQTVESIPEGIEVAAGSIGEFFNGKAEGPAGNNTTGGLVNVVNGFHKKLSATSGTDSQKGSPARNAADRIRILIDPSIAVHQLEVGNLSKVGMLEEGRNPRNSYMDPKKPTYGFHAGTSITAIIRSMIKNSTWWTNQVEQNDKITAANAQLSPGEQARAKKTTPIVRPKITARYKMLEYDDKANRHAYEATYIVTPAETAGQQSGNIGRSEIENVAKVYDYLFTGKNQDILELDIKFDLAFYNNVVTNTESSSEGTPSGNNKAVSGKDQGDPGSNNSDPITKTPLEKRPPASIENIGTASKEDIKKMKASALERSIMQSSAGDMITLDMTIMGDPAFIKQDDILYAADGDNANAFTDNGSIKQDAGDMYIRLKFKTFDDINHDTGLRYEARNIFPSSFQRQSTFDGFYRVMMLDNLFAKGRFTQQLVVVRTYVQDTDDVESDAATSVLSSLVSYGNEGGLGEAGRFAESALNRVTLTASQAVDEAQAGVGDFFANQTPIDAGEFEQVDENLIGTVDVTAESVVAVTQLNPIQADRVSRRPR